MTLNVTTLKHYKDAARHTCLTHEEPPSSDKDLNVTFFLGVPPFDGSGRTLAWADPLGLRDPDVSSMVIVRGALWGLSVSSSCTRMAVASGSTRNMGGACVSQIS